MLTTTVARADVFTIAWDANPEPQVLGYYVFIGTASGVYTTKIDVGTATRYTFPSALANTTYYLTVAAYVSGPVQGPYAPELVTTTGDGPTLSNPGNRTTLRGTALTLSLSATDPSNDPIVFAAFGLPTGLSVNPTTGVISGTPTVAGTYSVSVTAADASANVTTQVFTWTIVAGDTTAPTIGITSPTASATYSTSSVFITLTGAATDDVAVTAVTWANSAGGSGTAAGTTNWSVVVPLVVGANVITMTARDATNKTTTDVLTVTVTPPANQAPTVTITSPTSTTTYASNVATLSIGGTASDDAAVSSVKWSNDRGGSGTAAGTTTWSATGIALQSGTNVLTITATDAAGLSSTDTLSVTYTPVAGTLGLTALTANKTAPQVLGTTVTFTATASGGTAPYQYKWRIYNGATWSTIRNWSTSATFAWTPTSVNSAYQIEVWVRNAGNTTNAAENANSSRSLAFAISAVPTPLSLTSLTSDKPAPQEVGTPITFTTTATGGTAPYQYKWRVFDGSSWTTVQNWGTSATFTATPTAANPAYQVEVWARSAGNTTDAAENTNSSRNMAFAINATTTSLVVTGLTSNKAAPQTPATTVTFTVAASGGKAPYQFKWWVFDGYSWILGQDWSSKTTFAWTPTSANSAYRVGVWARSASSTTNAADNEESNRSVAFPIASAAAPLAMASLNADKASPQLVSTSIRFTAAAVGGTAPYSYKFRLFNGSSWSVARDWSTLDSFTWTPMSAGSAYQIEVWARSSGNSADAAENGAATTRTFVVTTAPTPTTLSLTALTADKIAPQASGATITFSAVAVGGKAPYQYKWWLFNGVTWDIMRDWSGSATVSWTPSVANTNYRIGVWVRSAGSTADASENDSSNGSLLFPITTGLTPLAITGLTSSLAAPQGVGTPVTFTATAAGGAGPYSYKWRVSNGTSWTVMQDWNTSSSFTWTPMAGGITYQIEVWARSAGRTADAPENAAADVIRSFSINSAPASPLRLVSLTASKASPQPSGTSITVTAAAVGGVPQYQYKWWLFDGVAWIQLTDWSSASSYIWKPATKGAAYRIGVWVRSANNTLDASDNDNSNGTVQFIIN